MVHWIIAILAGINGLWMIADGVHVLRNGKYIGPEVPGPWRHIVEAIGLDPLKIGPAFIFLGAFWLLALALHLGKISSLLLILAAFTTLWYLPLGTIISLAVLGLVFLTR
ncbi:MAG: hypothetical protein CR993_05075 [Rhodobacterales bacterium]|nr:MAG: hypothetical protein CR993_05075 [Rhodobacterales bacterium]